MDEPWKATSTKKIMEKPHVRYVLLTLNIYRYIDPSRHNFENCLLPWCSPQRCLGKPLAARLAQVVLRGKSWKIRSSEYFLLLKKYNMINFFNRTLSKYVINHLDWVQPRGSAYGCLVCVRFLFMTFLFSLVGWLSSKHKAELRSI